MSYFSTETLIVTKSLRISIFPEPRLPLREALPEQRALALLAPPEPSVGGNMRKICQYPSAESGGISTFLSVVFLFGGDT